MIALSFSVAAVVVALAASVTLFLLTRRFRQLQHKAEESGLEIEMARAQIQQLRGNLQGQITKATEAQSQLGERIDELIDRFDRVEMHAGLCVPPKPAASGFNINKRMEVIRMFQEGHSEETISEQLAVPMGEVRLLIYLERNAEASAGKSNRTKSSSSSHAA